jgi:pre-60S factor REI1
MYRKYGFFLPDREYLTDMEGLVGYCQEKIKLGHMCLYCHKVFPTWQGCQKHMVSKRHTKLKYEAGIDLEDLTLFYDFAKADSEFLTSVGITAPPQPTNTTKNNRDDVMNTETDGDVAVVEDDDGDDADWEDISDDEEMAEGAETDDAEDDALYDAYEEQLAQYGFDVNALGELVLPNGRVIGHRGLARYYKQRVPQNNTSTAVIAARRAAGERLFNGTVYNIHGREENALALAKAGIQPAQAAGRAARGILVKGEGGMYTSFSIYRYRAAMRKQRRGEFKGKLIEEKTKQNINRMDKKHNRLMNGVSVAHAAR